MNTTTTLTPASEPNLGDVAGLHVNCDGQIIYADTAEEALEAFCSLVDGEMAVIDSRLKHVRNLRARRSTWKGIGDGTGMTRESCALDEARVQALHDLKVVLAKATLLSKAEAERQFGAPLSQT